MAWIKLDFRREYRNASDVLKFAADARGYGVALEAAFHDIAGDMEAALAKANGVEKRLAKRKAKRVSNKVKLMAEAAKMLTAAARELDKEMKHQYAEEMNPQSRKRGMDLTR